MANAVVSVQGGPVALHTLLGQAPARIPTGGKIRPGIMVLTRKAAEHPEAKAIYRQGVDEGRSFEEIERRLAQAMPQLKSPLVPRNVRLAEAPSFGVPALKFDKNSKGAQAYLALAGEMLNRNAQTT